VKAAIDEAHKNNKRVAVHATERITAQLAVEAGADLWCIVWTMKLSVMHLCNY
jgi:imidazolonepropionase-like amidohydrolase